MGTITSLSISNREKRKRKECIRGQDRMTTIVSGPAGVTVYNCTVHLSGRVATVIDRVCARMHVHRRSRYSRTCIQSISRPPASPGFDKQLQLLTPRNAHVILCEQIAEQMGDTHDCKISLEHGVESLHHSSEHHVLSVQMGGRPGCDEKL